MLNEVTLIGRLNDNIKIEKTKDGDEYTIMVLDVPRIIPEKDGSYKSDIVDVKVEGKDINEISKKLKKADLIGIKGHVSTKKTNTEHRLIEIIADQIKYLSGNGKK